MTTPTRLVEVIDDATGEILDAIEGSEDLALTVLRRHDAHIQVKAWEATRARLDAIILKRQPEKHGVYGDVRASVKARLFKRFDAPRFAGDLAGGYEPTREELLSVIAAARDFDREALPDELRMAYDAACTKHLSNPWVESAFITRRAEVE